MAQRVGGALLLQAINVGTAAVFITLPAAATRGYAPIALLALGMFQGPFVPAHNTLKRNWVPADGPDKPVGLFILGLGNRLGGLAAASLTPALAVRYGWRAAARSYGIGASLFAVLWQLYAVERPFQFDQYATLDSRNLETAEVAVAPLEPEAEVPDESNAFEPRILRLRATQAVIAMHYAANHTEITLMQWAPTYLTTVLGASLE